MGSTIKPLGGIAKITLGVASSDGAAPTLPTGGVEVQLLEDRSSYTETVEWCGAHKSVKHQLELYTAAQYMLPDELLAGLGEGFVAHIALNSGTEIVAGWSEESGSDRALRLRSCTCSSGVKPASRGCKVWVWESTDGSTTI